MKTKLFLKVEQEEKEAEQDEHYKIWCCPFCNEGAFNTHVMVGDACTQCGAQVSQMQFIPNAQTKIN